jgi:hypothetical protein
VTGLFWIFFGVVSLLPILMLVTLPMLGDTQLSAARVSRDQTGMRRPAGRILANVAVEAVSNSRSEK